MERAIDCVEIEVACSKVLVKNISVHGLLKKAFGSKNLPLVLEMMEAGKLDGDLGAGVYDFIADEIANEAVRVWSGFIRLEHDDYPVHVNEFHGVYWVWSCDGDSVGYFLSVDSAISFVRHNWENLYEEGDDQGKSDSDLIDQTGVAPI